MKVIFLDFDGVLNSAGSFLLENSIRKDNKRRIGVKGPVNETFSHVSAANFQAVLDKYREVSVVISSTWRELFSLDWLKAKLEEYHIDSSRVIGVTPVDRWMGNRGIEIRQWLSLHPEVTHYVIIDDNDWGISAEHGESRFVQTTWEGGMTYSHMLQLCNKLSNQGKLEAKKEDAERKAEHDKLVEEIKNKPPMDDNF